VTFVILRNSADVKYGKQIADQSVSGITDDLQIAFTKLTEGMGIVLIFTHVSHAYDEDIQNLY
jgi:hypothetical protein